MLSYIHCPQNFGDPLTMRPFCRDVHGPQRMQWLWRRPTCQASTCINIQLALWACWPADVSILLKAPPGIYCTVGRATSMAVDFCILFFCINAVFFRIWITFLNWPRWNITRHTYINEYFLFIFLINIEIWKCLPWWRIFPILHIPLPQHDHCCSNQTT